MKDRNLFYNKRLKQYARNLRRNATLAEKIIWNEVLRKRQMKGYKFLSQRSVDRYIADFMCKELMLIIEVDAYTHQFDVAVNPYSKGDG